VTAIFLFLDLFLRFLEALSETLLHFLEFEGVGHKHAVGAVRRTQSLVLLEGGLDRRSSLTRVLPPSSPHSPYPEAPS